MHCMLHLSSYNKESFQISVSQRWLPELKILRTQLHNLRVLNFDIGIYFTSRRICRWRFTREVNIYFTQDIFSLTLNCSNKQWLLAHHIKLNFNRTELPSNPFSISLSLLTASWWPESRGISISVNLNPSPFKGHVQADYTGWKNVAPLLNLCLFVVINKSHVYSISSTECHFPNMWNDSSIIWIWLEVVHFYSFRLLSVGTKVAHGWIKTNTIWTWNIWFGDSLC